MTAPLGEQVEHQVTEEAFTAGQAGGRGEFQGLCGLVFIPRSDDRTPRPTLHTMLSGPADAGAGLSSTAPTSAAAPPDG